MTDSTASVEDELERALQVGLAVAAQTADRLARVRLERVREAQHAAGVEARRLEAQLRAEGGSAVARLAVVDRNEWWDRASAAEISAMWELALQWRDLEPRAALTADTIATQVQLRFGIAADALNGEKDPGRAGANAIAAVSRAEQRDGVLAAAAAAARLGPHDEAYDSPERRERSAAGLSAAGLPPDLVAAAMRADVAYAHPATTAPTSPTGDRRHDRRVEERTKRADRER